MFPLLLEAVSLSRFYHSLRRSAFWHPDPDRSPCRRFCYFECSQNDRSTAILKHAVQQRGPALLLPPAVRSRAIRADQRPAAGSAPPAARSTFYTYYRSPADIEDGLIGGLPEITRLHQARTGSCLDLSECFRDVICCVLQSPVPGSRPDAQYLAKWKDAARSNSGLWSDSRTAGGRDLPAEAAAHSLRLLDGPSGQSQQDGRRYLCGASDPGCPGNQRRLSLKSRTHSGSVVETDTCSFHNEHICINWRCAQYPRSEFSCCRPAVSASPLISRLGAAMSILFRPLACAAKSRTGCGFPSRYTSLGRITAMCSLAAAGTVI